MGTIDNQYIIVKLLRNNGVYEDDPQAYSITEYTNAWGRQCWGLAHSYEAHVGYQTETEYVTDPIMLWSVNGGLTEAGLKFLQQHAREHGDPIPQTAEDI